MGGRGSKSRIQPQPIQMPRMQMQMQAQPPQPQPPQQPPQQPPIQQTPPQPQAAALNQNFPDTDNAPFHDLLGGRNYYQSQLLDIDATTALTDYLDPNTTPGSLYNFSQNMNYAVANGQALNPQQQYAWDSITGAMHNLGQNLNLTRYDHGSALDEIMSQAGIPGTHDRYSIGQLKQMLTGVQFTDKRILSTSFNNFKNASDPSTFTTREVKITYRAKASTQALMPGISQIGMYGRGKGDDFGEMLLAPSGGGHNAPRVVDIRYTGSGARPPRGSKSNLSLKQIEIVVEID